MMLAAPTRSTRTALIQVRALSRTAVASNPLAETHSSQPAPPPPHFSPSPKSTSQAPSPSPAPVRRTRLSPTPRPAPPLQPGTRIPVLPPQFGKNQVLAVPDKTRALLEEIVAGFDAPVRYAFAYGSGVFGQDGYKDSVSCLSLLWRWVWHVAARERQAVPCRCFDCILNKANCASLYRTVPNWTLCSPLHTQTTSIRLICTRTPSTTHWRHASSGLILSPAFKPSHLGCGLTHTSRSKMVSWFSCYKSSDCSIGLASASLQLSASSSSHADKLLIINRRNNQIRRHYRRQPMRRLARLEVALHGREDAQAHSDHQGSCSPWIFCVFGLDLTPIRLGRSSSSFDAAG